MDRHLYQRLLEWKTGQDRKPMLLQGARQVGKTYLLRQLGEREYAAIAYLNFERTPELASLFDLSLDPTTLIESMSAAVGKPIRAGETLIFLDEIQACPRALTSLKYFCEEAPEYHVAAAGSLLGVSVGKTTSFPVGKVSFMTLYPMSFFEYLSAAGEDLLMAELAKRRACAAMPQLLHDKLTRSLKYFLFLGGMPEVIQHYLEHRDIEAVRHIQGEILQAYERDFSKHTSANTAIRIAEIWRSIPSQLARENKKFRYRDVRKGGRASRFESAIEWLRGAGLLHPVYSLKVPRLPLSGYVDESRFKLYLLDSGLLGAMLDLDSSTIVIGDALFAEYGGAFIESFVVTELVKKGFEQLYYWTSEGEAEVDIVFKPGAEIIPLEVKSGMSRRTKSLRVYGAKYGASRVLRTSPRNFTRDGDLTNVPLYAVAMLPDLL